MTELPQPPQDAPLRQDEKALAPAIEPRPDAQQGGVPEPHKADRSQGSEGHHFQLLGVLLGGLLAILGGIAGQWFQAEYQRDQLAIQLREKEQESAASALLEIEGRLDAPVWRALALHDALVNGSPKPAVDHLRDQYEASKDAWKLNLNRSRVLAAIYFGNSAELDSLDARLDYVDGLLTSAEVRRRQAREYRGELTKLRGRTDGPGRTAKLAIDTLLSTFADLDRLGREQVLSLHQISYFTARGWSAQIQSRRTGSFDPLARYMFSPADEERMMRELDEKQKKADSLTKRK